MTSKHIVHTEHAPKAIGPYSQAVKVGNTVYISGQIPLEPVTMTILSPEIDAQIHQVFKNLQAVCVAAGGGLEHIVKLSIFLTDLSHFARVNEIMATYFTEPYPARAAIGVAALPKASAVEMDAIMVL